MGPAAKPRQVPPPPDSGGAKAHPYTRFIPREELAGFEAWALGDISEDGVASAGSELFGELSGTAAFGTRMRAEPEAPPVNPGELIAQQLRAARQAGYQDGYRDGLVALEGFKQSFAAQTTAQIGTLVASIGRELDGLQQELAASVARVATALARRVVRSELATEPERVAKVAAEAVDALLLSARHIVVRVHPDDVALVSAGAGETIAARGARLVADPALERGGCRVESDIGGVEAQVGERWRQAAASLGATAPWRSEDDDA